MADPEFVSAVDEPNYRQVGVKATTGRRLRGKARSVHAPPTATSSIPSKFETLLIAGDSELDGFRSRTSRFKPHLADIPGPGAYLASTSPVMVSDSHSKKGYGVGFASKKDRFAESGGGPGPGRYESRDFVTRSTMHHFSQAEHSHVFRSDQTLPRTTIHQQRTPGPGAYDPSPARTKERRNRAHALLVRVEPSSSSASVGALAPASDEAGTMGGSGGSGDSRTTSARVGKSVSSSELLRGVDIGDGTSGRSLGGSASMSRGLGTTGGGGGGDGLMGTRLLTASERAREERGEMEEMKVGERILNMVAEGGARGGGGGGGAGAGEGKGSSSGKTRKTKSIRVKSKSLTADQPFLSTSHRFHAEKQEVPPPGSYDPPLPHSNGFTAHEGVSVPFKSTTHRSTYLEADAGGARALGPGYYEPSTTPLVDGVDRDAKQPPLPSPMFARQTINRFGVPIQRRKPMDNTPGPGAYQPPIPSEIHKESPSRADRLALAASGEEKVESSTRATSSSARATSAGVRDYASPSKARLKHKLMSFPINSPPPAVKASPERAHSSPSSVGARAMAIGDPLVAHASSVRPPGPAYYNPAAADRKSFHLNSVSRWV